MNNRNIQTGSKAPMYSMCANCRAKHLTETMVTYRFEGELFFYCNLQCHTTWQIAELVKRGKANDQRLS